MKIVFTLNHFLPDQIGGTEIYTFALAKQLRQNGFDVQILIPNYTKSHDETYIYKDILVYKYAEPSISNRKRITGNVAPLGISAFKSYLERVKPDIIHFQEIAGGTGITTYHLQIAKSVGIKTITTFHVAAYTCMTSTMMYKNRIPCDGKINLKKCSLCYLTQSSAVGLAQPIQIISNFLSTLGLNPLSINNKIGTLVGVNQLVINRKNRFLNITENSDKIIALSNWYKEVLVLNGIKPSKLKYISQGLTQDYSVNSSDNITNYFTKKPLKIMFLGRLTRYKGIHTILDAISVLNPDDFILNIYGDFTQDRFGRWLKKKSSKLENVNWHGKLSNDHVIEVMKKHDLLCTCSTIAEMSPLVIQEAFAANLPVIASNVSGNNEQITHNYNGLLFKKNDYKSLALQIIRCFNEPGLLPSIKSNMRPPKSFKVIAEEHIDLYKSL